MDTKPLNFSQWMDFEACRIVNLGLKVSDEHKADYMKVQILAALKKAFAHGRDGLSEDEMPRVIY
jgi:hypothetical protein